MKDLDTMPSQPLILLDKGVNPHFPLFSNCPTAPLSRPHNVKRPTPNSNQQPSSTHTYVHSSKIQLN